MIDPARLAAQRVALGQQPEPVHYRKPKTGERFDMQTGIVCVKCRAKCLSKRNRIGLCHACWEGTGKRGRVAYRKLHEERNAGLAPGMEAA